MIKLRHHLCWLLKTVKLLLVTQMLDLVYVIQLGKVVYVNLLKVHLNFKNLKIVVDRTITINELLKIEVML